LGRRQSADKFWLRMGAVLDFAERPHFAWPMLLVGVGGTALIWYVIFQHPTLFASLYEGLFDKNVDRFNLSVMLLGLEAAIAFPYLAVFTLAHLLFSAPKHDHEPEVGVPLSSFGRPDKSVREWRIRIVAGMVGVLNMVALLIVSFS